MSLLFLVKFANIMLAIYKTEYFGELNQYIAHANEMLSKFESIEGRPKNEFMDVSDAMQETRIRRRQRLLQYLKWFK